MTTKIVGFPPPDVFMDKLVYRREAIVEIPQADYSNVLNVECKPDNYTPMHDRLHMELVRAGLMKDPIRFIVDAHKLHTYRFKSELTDKAVSVGYTNYQKEVERREAARRTTVDDTTPTDNSVERDPYRTYEFDLIGLQVLLALDDTCDPVLTIDEARRAGHCERQTPEASRVLMLLETHAAQILAYTHSTHHFQLSMTGKYARFLRWDRAGCIISDRFNYVDQPHILSDFIMRINDTSALQYGIDLSASELFPGDYGDFYEARDEALLKSKIYNDKQIACLNTRNFGWLPTTVCSRLNSSYAQPAMGFSAVVTVGIYYKLSVCGSGTRMYINYDWDVFAPNARCVKDGWRLVHPLLLPEADVYTALKGVEHVPQDVRGSDLLLVPDSGNDEVQRTETQDWAAMDESWKVSFGHFDEYIHHRIRQEVLFPVQTSKDSKQCMIVVYHCIMALFAAHAAGIQHGGISAANLMMDKDGNARLTGWDLASRTNVLHQANQANKPLRVCDGKYESIACLLDPTKHRDLLDNIETSFWAALELVTHFFANDTVYDMQIFTEQPGGPMKERFLKDDIIFEPRWKCQPLQDLICELRSHFACYYAILEEYKTLERLKASNLEADVERVESQLEKCTAQLTATREKLLDRSFWSATFEKAIERQDWLPDDAIPDKWPAEGNSRAPLQEKNVWYYAEDDGFEHEPVEYIPDPDDDIDDPIENSDFSSDEDDDVGDRPSYTPFQAPVQDNKRARSEISDFEEDEPEGSKRRRLDWDDIESDDE